MDTAINPTTRWGVDPALGARASVVRFWRDYLAVRGDTARRRNFWSGSGGSVVEGKIEQDLAAEDYIVGADATLVEALPLIAGDSSRWMLRTVYAGAGSAQHPRLLAMERSFVVREGSRWALVQPRQALTTGWLTKRVGQLAYVVHPSLSWNARRAQAAARWTERTARRFGINNREVITYYQLPHLEAAFELMGFDWALSTDRVGGRANPEARLVLAADPRFAEEYHHEIAHVLLAPWLGRDVSAFVNEGIAYWLGGARGVPFPELMRQLAAFLRQHPDLTLERILNDDFGEAAAGTLFPSAAAVFELAYRNGGDRGVQEFVKAANGIAPDFRGVAKALNLDPAHLESRWQEVVLSYVRDSRGLRASNPRRTLSLGPPSVHISR